MKSFYLYIDKRAEKINDNFENWKTLQPNKKFETRQECDEYIKREDIKLWVILNFGISDTHVVATSSFSTSIQIWKT